MTAICSNRPTLAVVAGVKVGLDEAAAEVSRTEKDCHPPLPRAGPLVVEDDVRCPDISRGQGQLRQVAELRGDPLDPLVLPRLLHPNIQRQHLVPLVLKGASCPPWLAPCDRTRKTSTTERRALPRVYGFGGEVARNPQY